MKCNCLYAKDEVFGQWCDKVGGYNFECGFCGDELPVSIPQEHYTKKRKRSKRERDQKYKEHLQFVANCGCNYPPPVICVDKLYDDEELLDHPKSYYKRCYRGRGRSSISNYHKRKSNKAIRRYKDKIPNGYWCHKLYDFWRLMY